MPITTTTIGAYPKPKDAPISDWFPDPDDEEARRAGQGLLKSWKKAHYEQGLAAAGERAEALFRRATEEVVRDQVDAGVDIPTDGEVRRENYIYYQCRHLDGVDFNRLTHKSVRDGAFTAEIPTIVGPIGTRELVLARDWAVAQAFTDRPIKITLPGPMTITDSIGNDYYDDEKAQGAALAQALNAEVRSLADAGCRYIQIDEPVFARKPAQALAFGLENLERAFHGTPKEVTRVVHMCCGYPKALDVSDYLKADPQAYFLIAEAMDAATIDAVSMEDAHRHNDLSLLERYTQTTVLLGLIDVATSQVETVDDIKDRLTQALQHIDADRLMAAPDCGLGLLGRELAMRKLNRLCEAAHGIHV